jgi:hypothetical protein
MSMSLKFLPAVALAVALSPFAAQARSDHPPGPAQYYLAPLHHDPVMTDSATIDNPTTIYSGWTAQKFPVSAGGYSPRAR